MMTGSNGEKVAQAARILHGIGLIEVFGHVSLRADDTSCFILGHLHTAGRMLSDTTREDIVRIDFDGNVLEGSSSPPGEFFLHTEILRSRPDINAVVHVHPIACIILSTLGLEIKPIWMQATQFADGTPIFEGAEQIDNREVGGRVAKALSDKRAVLLKGHGVAVVGASVEEAVFLSFSLERTARMQVDAAPLGKPSPLPTDSFVNGMPRGLSLEELVHAHWDYWVSKYPLK
jgi:ribulose-5-phosphate 4-epimerase/fuculose-1-phosphate aldolase